MMNQTRHRRILPDQSSESGRTFGTLRQSSIKDPILSKRVCFYKSGDPQFNGLHTVINNRIFKTFDALLDSLSKKVPLPFGVRNITTPQGGHAIYTLDELEDGKSYICSDTRKVKPINLVKARKKLPPWYHARPVSSRRRTVQQARHFPGRSIHKQEPVVVRTPKKLLVFRNGDPSVKHTVVLNKRSSPTFQSILEYVSELMQFQVVKLHTTDGRRVDGLPGLIMCSGTVVAAGREPFKSSNYNTQKSPAPTKLPTKQVGLRRLKSLKRKKKTFSHTSKSRKFSPSSEQYIMNQIHNSKAESSWDHQLPSNSANSADFESSHILQSVSGTEGGTCLGDGAEGQDVTLPTDDDIEKSFCVNQDGSMTVEMRVRLTIKEEETVHWTTTLSRSSVANQLNASCLTEPEAEQELCSPNSDPLDLRSSASSIDNFNEEKIKHSNYEESPYISNGTFNKNSNEKDDIKVHRDVESSVRVPSSGNKQIRKKQASMESIKSLTSEGIQEGVVGSYSYNEQIENGAITEQYCLIKQSTTRPVPKPRRLNSLDASNAQSRNISTFKSAGMTEILQVESSGEEVTETVHIYEEQTCQDNFLPNMCAQHMSASRIPFGRPATSGTGKNDFDPPPYRPSTASESISIWRTDKTSVQSDLTLSSMMTNRQQQFFKSTKSKDKPEQREVSKGKKHRVINKRVHRLLIPVKRRKGKPVDEIRNKVKTFSSAEYIKRIYGNKSKSTKHKMKPKKTSTEMGKGGVTKNNSQPLDDKTKCILKHPNIPSPLTQNESEAASLETNRLNVSSTNVSQVRGTITQQTALHQEKKGDNMSGDINKSTGLPHSSSSITNEYVQNWLVKAHFNPTSYPDMENKILEAANLAQTENSSCGESEYNHGLVTAADKGKCLEEESVLQPCQPLEFDPMLKNYLRSSVKHKIWHFENKSNHSQEKAAVTQPEEFALVHAITTNAENHTSVAQNNREQIKAPLNSICYEMNLEMSSGNTVENKSRPLKIALQKATPSNTISMDQLLLPPPPAKLAELTNTEYCTMEVTSVARSPFYRLSSVSSQISDNQPLSISSTSDKAISPDDQTMETTSSSEEASLSRTKSIKRAPLVSNLSFERNMSLRKSSLQRYTLGSDATPINTVGDDANVLPNGISSTGTLLPSINTQKLNGILELKSNPSCISVSPTSLTFGEKMSSASILSNDDPATDDIPSIKTKTTKTQTSSPKTLVKKIISPFQNRKTQSYKSASELANISKNPLHNQHSDKTMSTRQAHATPPKEKRKTLYENKLQKRQSPYSKSLDMTSPPVRPKSNTKMLSRNLSSDNASEPEKSTKSKTLSQRKHHKIPQMDESTITDQEVSVPQTQLMPQQFNITNQPNMKPVLEKICYSIKSIRQITQNKRPSCLEKSNSLPDFSSHVASAFGSSSKALLAFLSIMTLKEGIINFNKSYLSPNNVSCAEALKIIDSLREIASIEDSHKLRDSLSHLQQSTSKQLLQSWKGFQELSDTFKSRSSSQEDHIRAVSPKNHFEEHVINQIIDNLNIPEKLKDELALLSEEVKAETNEEINVDALSITEKFANIDQPNKSDVHSIPQIQETVKHELTNQTIKDENSQLRQSDVARSPPDGEHLNNRQLYNAEDRESFNSYEEENMSEKKQHKVKLNQDTSNKNGVVSFEKDLEHHEVHCRQLKMQSEDFLVSGLTTEDEEGQKFSSATKDIQSCKKSMYSSETGEEHSSEEEHVKGEEIKQETREVLQSSYSDSHSQEEENKEPSSDYYVELNVSRKESIFSPDSANQSLSEEETQELKGKKLCSESQCEKEQESQKPQINVRVHESGGNSDVDEPSYSEEEQSEIECENRTEECLSGIEGEETISEEELLQHQSEEPVIKSKTLKIEEAKENGVSAKDEAHFTGKLQICHTKTFKSVHGDLSSMYSLSRQHRFNADEDSENYHCNYEEQAEIMQKITSDKQIRSLDEEDLSYYEKESSSNMDRCMGERYKEYQETPVSETNYEVTIYDNIEKVKHHPDEIISQSVAERVSLLEKQVADGKRRKNVPERSASRRFSQRNAMESDVGDSPSDSPTSKSALYTRSAPQSSLSFSYDSSGVITTESEGNRVRSIREMFLAKTDIQHGHRRFPSPNASQLSELRTNTSLSGGYQSQTSTELSNCEDYSPRKSITKGFVMRTIERLYGKKDADHDEKANERPPSAPKQKMKEYSSIFSPLHTARSKKMSDLSYFSSTNALDTLTEAKRCIAFNAQVGPEDSVPIDNGQWLLREKMLIRKSVSDPVGINKAFTFPPRDEEMCEDTEQNVQISLSSTQSQQRDREKSLSKKCTYFSLPHASDSDVCQDDSSTVSKSGVNGDSIMDTKHNSEDFKVCAEKNDKLPGVGVSNFKMMDNKVHPLVEVPSNGEVVVVQPGKGQGVMNRRLQEPDMLDLLYNFCGQHCPIL